MAAGDGASYAFGESVQVRIAANWVTHVVWLVLCAMFFGLGAIVFGKDCKARIAALERRLLTPQSIAVAGELISINDRPGARFAQKFEMLARFPRTHPAQ